MSTSRTPRTAKKAFEFLALLAESPSVSSAARACNLARRTLYDFRAADPAFAAAWDEALEIGLDAVEDEAILRARDGVEQPVFRRGLQYGTVRKYSDPLLIFLLEHLRPQRYGAAIPPESPAVPLPTAPSASPRSSG